MRSWENRPNRRRQSQADQADQPPKSVIYLYPRRVLEQLQSIGLAEVEARAHEPDAPRTKCSKCGSKYIVGQPDPADGQWTSVKCFKRIYGGFPWNQEALNTLKEHVDMVCVSVCVCLYGGTEAGQGVWGCPDFPTSSGSGSGLGIACFAAGLWLGTAARGSSDSRAIILGHHMPVPCATARCLLALNMFLV